MAVAGGENEFTAGASAMPSCARPWISCSRMCAPRWPYRVQEDRGARLRPWRGMRAPCVGSAVGIAATPAFPRLAGGPAAKPVPVRAAAGFEQCENPFRDHLATEPIVQERGRVKIPTGPGLGIEIDRSSSTATGWADHALRDLCPCRRHARRRARRGRRGAPRTGVRPRPSRLRRHPLRPRAGCGRPHCCGPAGDRRRPFGGAPAGGGGPCRLQRWSCSPRFRPRRIHALPSITAMRWPSGTWPRPPNPSSSPSRRERSSAPARPSAFRPILAACTYEVESPPSSAAAPKTSRGTGARLHRRLRLFNDISGSELIKARWQLRAGKNLPTFGRSAPISPRRMRWWTPMTCASPSTWTG